MLGLKLFKIKKVKLVLKGHPSGHIRQVVSYQTKIDCFIDQYVVYVLFTIKETEKQV